MGQQKHYKQTLSDYPEHSFPTRKLSIPENTFPVFYHCGDIWTRTAPTQSSPSPSLLPVAQVTGFGLHQCLQEVQYGRQRPPLQQRGVHECEDPRQHRRADLGQRGGAGSGHAGQQGDRHLNRAQDQFAAAVFLYSMTR